MECGIINTSLATLVSLGNRKELSTALNDDEQCHRTSILWWAWASSTLTVTLSQILWGMSASCSSWIPQKVGLVPVVTRMAAMCRIWGENYSQNVIIFVHVVIMYYRDCVCTCSTWRHTCPQHITLEITMHLPSPCSLRSLHSLTNHLSTECYPMCIIAHTDIFVEKLVKRISHHHPRASVQLLVIMPTKIVWSRLDGHVHAMYVDTHKLVHACYFKA